MTDELKPCPFCGGEARVFPRTCDRDTPYDEADRAYPIVRCESCYAQACGENWGKPETAITAWNTRPTEAAIIERCAKVVERYQWFGQFAGSLYAETIKEEVAAAIRALAPASELERNG